MTDNGYMHFIFIYKSCDLVNMQPPPPLEYRHAHVMRLIGPIIILCFTFYVPKRMRILIFILYIHILGIEEVEVLFVICNLSGRL